MFYIAEMQLGISINQLTSLEEMGECASAASEQHKCLTEGGSILTSFSPAKKKKENELKSACPESCSLHSGRMYALLP